MLTSLYLSDLMLLAANTHIFPPSLLASAYLFIAVLTHQDTVVDAQKLEKARQLFGDWYSPSDLEQCVDHVRLSWTESRHNPNFSRFDAVNNKYEQFADIVNIRQL